jgi:putative permease
MSVISNWFRRQLADQQVILLTALLILGLAIIVFLGGFLAPVFAGLVIAYLLDSPAEALVRRGVPHTLSVCLVFIAFLTGSVFTLLALMPLLSEQLTQLVLALPIMITSVQELLLGLPERFPNLIETEQIAEVTSTMRKEMLQAAQQLVVLSWGSIGNFVSLIVYVFLVPLVVFFFLKDKRQLIGWLASYLPEERDLTLQVGRDLNRRIGDYVRGKSYEIVIVTFVTLVFFLFLDLRFALLLSILTGLSVLIPYIGVAAVAVPVTFVALFQFGVTTPFFVALGTYAFIQMIDGNVLAPLLLSEVVSLHPIAIVVAILIFGGIWGFWGLFFAIPLATLADCVLRAWPGAPGGLLESEPS